MNPRQQIIALLRGQVACPVLSTLGQLGWFERMGAEPFRREDFSPPPDPAAFKSVMSYLGALGLIEPPTGAPTFVATEIGRKVFARYGAFCILNSYESYMRKLQTLLVPDGSARPTVDRLRNVIGSGALHFAKFFRPALEMIKSQDMEVLIDIGCGDGRFLLTALRAHPHARVVGVDLSEIAVRETVENLRARAPRTHATGVVSDGIDVAGWASRSGELRGRRSLIGLWFLVHEISGGRCDRVIEFFRQLHRHCPGAELLLGEIVRLPEQTLALNHELSVMPELTLLHDLSGQGLLGWHEWNTLVREIPYTVLQERRFDPVITADEETQPSSFVWYLVPREA